MFSARISFVLLITICSTFFVAHFASADETITVRGKVGGVIAGPSIEKDSDDNKDDKDKKSGISDTSQPTVSIEPANLQGAVFSTVSGLVQFTTPRPSFKGQTNIQNAHVTLIFRFGNFSFRATTQANEEGVWNLISPEDFPNGNFQTTILAVHPTEPAIKSETKTEFTVLATQNTAPWSEQFLENASMALFDLSVRIPEQYKTVSPGENIIASIQLVNFSATGSPVDVLVEYSIQDDQGREVLRLKETVAVGTKLSYLKTFYTLPDLKEGTYHLVVKTPSRNIIALATAAFTIKGESELTFSPLAKVDYSVILIGVGGIFAMFIFLSYFEFVRFLKAKKHIRMFKAKFLKRFF